MTYKVVVLGKQTREEIEEQMRLWREYTSSPAIQALRDLAKKLPAAAASSESKET